MSKVERKVQFSKRVLPKVKQKGHVKKRKESWSPKWVKNPDPKVKERHTPWSVRKEEHIKSCVVK